MAPSRCSIYLNGAVPLLALSQGFSKKKPISVIQVTNIHFLLSLFCAWLILEGHILESCFLLIVKGVLDAVDGELARIRERPSHVGRYWDTVADTIGLIAVMWAFGTVLGWNIALTSLLILSILLQYSFFNHFSILVRVLGSGDSTSRIDERVRPVAQPWESQTMVNIFHTIYVLFFSWQDSLVSKISGKGSKNLRFGLTVSSFLGYGMQSIVIFLLALTQNLDSLPHLVLGVNVFLVAIVLLRSRLG
ncbi:CDP-alcohol phosphatidyltransferase family protein [Candidatus Poseidoniales archaeon]|nr:CDP-alcohol phosphatidyltransferase family protein [Candidatus Poseidoniales archaeon]